jgi:hypothetical protein
VYKDESKIESRYGLPGGGRVHRLQIGSLNLAVLAECWFPWHQEGATSRILCLKLFESVVANIQYCELR